MHTLYLRCEENEPEGEFASSVFIYSSLSEPKQMNPRVTRRLSNRVTSQKIPIEILGELEAAIIKELKEHPSTRDIFKGTDGLHRFRNYTRHIGYHASLLPVVDRNNKIFEVYQRYVQSF